ncbi:MAG: AAA family ATPase [Promethearchaeota archaeon]
MKIKLSEFRVQNFRCIDDSGWIRVNEITALVGINESGKTALLNALHTLNPGSGEFNIDPIRDFPRDRVVDDYSEDCTIAQGHFLIPKDYIKEKKLDKKFNVPPEKDLTLILERRYNKILYYSFKPQLDSKKYVLILKNALKDLRKRINRKQVSNSEDSLFTENIRKSLLINIDACIKRIDDSYEEDKILILPEGRKEFASLLDSYVRDFAKFIDHAKKEIEPFLNSIEDMAEELRQKSISEQLLDEIKQDIPIFIYFEDYNVLNGSVVIPDLIVAINGDIRFREFKIQETLFKHVGLDPREIYNLGAKGNSEGISEKKQADLKKRKILLDNASKQMTDTLNNYFRERNYNVEYNVDGQFLEILISDQERPAKINLEDRSKGFKWYFSFFLIFLVESKGTHKNAVLLLDEPGIHLHLQAQFNLVEFFKKLKETNQIIYTTHSPFLIDENQLDQVRSVYENENGKTKVTEDYLIPDKKSIFPLQAALSYNTSQLFYNCLKHLLVENKIIYNYINTINIILTKLGKKTLDKDIVIIPCKNASNIVSYARLYVDLENYPVILLNSDKNGRNTYDILTKTLFSIKKKNVLMIGDLINHRQNSKIEDLFGKKLLIKCLNNKKLASPLVSVSDMGNDRNFVNALIKYTKENNIKLVKQWRYKLSINLQMDFSLKDANYIIKKIPTEKIATFEKLIESINNLIDNNI